MTSQPLQFCALGLRGNLPRTIETTAYRRHLKSNIAPTPVPPDLCPDSRRCSRVRLTYQKRWRTSTESQSRKQRPPFLFPFAQTPPMIPAVVAGCRTGGAGAAGAQARAVSGRPKRNWGEELLYDGDVHDDDHDDVIYITAKIGDLTKQWAGDYWRKLYVSCLYRHVDDSGRGRCPKPPAGETKEHSDSVVLALCFSLISSDRLTSSSVLLHFSVAGQRYNVYFRRAKSHRYVRFVGRNRIAASSHPAQCSIITDIVAN